MPSTHAHTVFSDHPFEPNIIVPLDWLTQLWELPTPAAFKENLPSSEILQTVSSVKCTEGGKTEIIVKYPWDD